MARKRKNRPFKESVFFESLLFKIIFLPFRILWSIIHAIDFIFLRLWRIKNIDMPYKKRLKK